MKEKADACSKAGQNNPGRPPGFAQERRLYAKTAQAIAQMARAGADHLNGCAGLTVAPRSGPESKMWWGGERLAAVLAVGASASAFNRLATGRHAITAENAVCYMNQVIKAGLIPPEALTEQAPTAGHARALAPFQSIVPELRQLGAFAMPGSELGSRVDSLASNFRTALGTRKEVARDDRSRLRCARTRAVQALLASKATAGSPESKQRQGVALELASALEELSSAMSNLSVTTWTLRDSPREALAADAARLVPAGTVMGEPDFHTLFGWLVQHAVPAVPSRAEKIQRFCSRVRSRWDVELLPAASFAGSVLDDRSSLRVIDWCFNLDEESRCLDFEDDDAKSCEPQPVARKIAKLLSMSSLAPARLQQFDEAQRRFLKKVCTPLKPYNFEFMVVMAMAERWFFGDQEPDDVETEFTDWLRRVQDWAKRTSQLSPATDLDSGPQMSCAPLLTCPLTEGDIKRRVKQLVRLDTRPCWEMDLDLPQVVPSASAAV